MALIKSKFITRKEEVLEVLPMAASIDVKELFPYLWKAENEVIKPILGAAQMESLADGYDAYVSGDYDPNLLDEPQTELLIRVQMALVNIAVRGWAPFVIGSISSKGITEASGENTKAARLATINLMLEAAEADGNRSVESMLELLDENRASYLDWVDSPEMVALFSGYFVTAADFNEYFYIGGSRYTFLRVQPQVKEAKRLVDRVIWEMGPELIAEQKDGNLTAANTELLALVKKAVANLAMADALLMMRFEVGSYGVTLMATSAANRDVVRTKTPVGDGQLSVIREKAKVDGMAALEQIKDLIYGNIDDYPTFRDGAHYTPDAPAPERFVNEETAKVVLM